MYRTTLNTGLSNPAALELAYSPLVKGMYLETARELGRESLLQAILKAPYCQSVHEQVPSYVHLEQNLMSGLELHRRAAADDGERTTLQ